MYVCMYIKNPKYIKQKFINTFIFVIIYKYIKKYIYYI